MSISSLTGKEIVSPAPHPLMKQDSMGCAEFGRQYEVSVESWVYDSYGLPLLERQSLYTGCDAEEARVCFRLAVAASAHRACRVTLCCLPAASDEDAYDPATDWDLGG